MHANLQRKFPRPEPQEALHSLEPWWVVWKGGKLLQVWAGAYYTCNSPHHAGPPPGHVGAAQLGLLLCTRALPHAHGHTGGGAGRLDCQQQPCAAGRGCCHQGHVDAVSPFRGGRFGVKGQGWTDLVHEGLLRVKRSASVGGGAWGAAVPGSLWVASPEWVGAAGREPRVPTTCVRPNKLILPSHPGLSSLAACTRTCPPWHSRC